MSKVNEKYLQDLVTLPKEEIAEVLPKTLIILETPKISRKHERL